MNETEPVVSVAEFNQRLRHVVEDVSRGEWVEGEVTSMKLAPSGHAYFCLKDEREPALLDCVMYRSSALKFRRLLVNGTRVQVRGRATVWVPRGRLQFTVELARAAGLGAHLLALEELKRKLAAEGLFDPERKRPVPTAPRVIGVVTSAVGAAFQDIVAVAFRRGGAHLVLSPALVQGQGAAESLIAAIERIERHPLLDVLIIGRGGGSNDDLMAFNDERVVRRLAAVRVPVVSAVGHDIDTTLSDWVADVRAATPSQAAELTVVDQTQREERLNNCVRGLHRCMAHRLADDRATLDLIRSRVSDPRFAFLQKQQVVDDLMLRAASCARARVRKGLSLLAGVERRLHARHPLTVLSRARHEFAPYDQKLRRGMHQRLIKHKLELADRTTRLEGLSPLAILSRGYAIARRPDGRAVRSTEEIELGGRLSLTLHRGMAVVEVQEKRDPSPNSIDGTPNRPGP
jgi:exodeoxyribonuclease VII large subunit